MKLLTIRVCPTCDGLAEHLGGGRQGCGRHLGTTYDRRAGVSRPQDRGAEFVEVDVIPADSPNVLSEGEAREVARYLEGSGRPEIQSLWKRLSDFAKEGSTNA